MPVLSSGRRAKPFSSTPKMFLERAADAGRVRLRVVDRVGRDGPVASAIGVDPGQEQLLPCFAESRRPVAVDRELLLVGERGAGIRTVELEEESTIGDTAGDGGAVGEAHARVHCVEKPGIVLHDGVLLNRPSGTTSADGETNRSGQLVDAFLRHHEGLGRQHVVAVRLEDVE